MKALLIIDMQKISFTPETPRFDTPGVIERINKLANNFRKQGDKVIYIQHDGTKDGFCKPNTQEWEILDDLIVDSNDIIISKTVNDSFYKSKLDEVLKANSIEELVITGCATDFCVDATIKSAFTRHYKITVISDAHTTADRPHLDAEKVIEHYNWIWKEFIPVNGKMNVLSYKDYTKEYEFGKH